MLCLPIRIFPCVGFSSAIIILIVVVLPAPFGPAIGKPCHHYKILCGNHFLPKKYPAFFAYFSHHMICGTTYKYYLST